MCKEKIKFRAYIEETKEMMYSDDWDNVSWNQIKEWNEQGKLMQVTGLKDINKNDIACAMHLCCTFVAKRNASRHISRYGGPVSLHSQTGFRIDGVAFQSMSEACKTKK